MPKRTPECKVEECEFNGRLHEFPPFRVWRHRNTFFVVGPKGLVEPPHFDKGTGYGFFSEAEAESFARSKSREVGH